MVRTTIACAWCRRSKIKCIHQGQPPCRNCLRNGRTSHRECILSGPDIHPVKKRKMRVAPDTHVQDPTGNVHREDTIDIEDVTSHRSELPDAETADIGSNDVLTHTPRSEILQAASNFRLKFPELSFLPIGRFEIASAGKSDLLLMASVMALCSQYGDPEEYVAYVKTGLSRVLLNPPHLNTVQSLLLLAMYDWGHGNGYSAWMATGMAIRMIQTLETMNNQKRLDQSEQEVYNRTFWSCFVMDRLVCCGPSQAFTLPLEQMHVHLPIGEQDFIFGHLSSTRTYISDIKNSNHTNIDHSYSVLVRGFDIWSRILKWVIKGGRRQRGMSTLANCPWTPASPWKNLFDELQIWRQIQHPRLKYPEVRAAGHVSLGHGERFTYINLIYYVSILFLSREYIPFLPKPDSEPQGPIDPPFLEAVAPDGWWAERASQLFDAALQITTLFQEIEALDTPLLTPFPGFCCFSAATMNAYVLYFPRMNFGNSVSTAAKLLELNTHWLSRFKSIWPMGNGWFKTILQTRKLYSKASRDQRRFQGKTRADFEALEASIHNSSGVSSMQEEATADPGAQRSIVATGHEAEAALGLQQLSDPNTGFQHSASSFDGISLDEFSDFNQWNHVWPLWGEQQSGSLTAGGFQYEYDFGGHGFGL